LFNVSLGGCQASCAPRLYYNSDLQTCSEGIYISDVNAFNIVSKVDSYNTWKNIQNTKAKASERVFVCDINTPFSINGVCSSCPYDKPLFDIDQ